MPNLRVLSFVDKNESPNLFVLLSVRLLTLAVNEPLCPLGNALISVVRLSYHRPLLITIASIT